MLKDGVDGGNIFAFDLKLAEAVDVQEVGMAERLNAAPSRQDLVLIKVTFDNTDENGFAVCVASGEERAAPLGLHQLRQGEGAIYGDAFIFRPETHNIPAIAS